MLVDVRGRKLLILLAVLTVGLAVTAACNTGDKNEQAPSTAGPDSTISPSSGTPGTPVPTVESRATVTPSAYEPPANSANVLDNPGFEDGNEYWFGLGDQTVETTSAVAHSGHTSAYLKMRGAAEATGAELYNLVQEVAPQEFPELISGYYQVDNWKRGTEKQYLQFAVVVFASTNLTLDKAGVPLPTPYPNHQVLYPLAGISVDPLDPALLANAFVIFVGRDEPRQGEWVYFESNIKKDFEEKWGAVPEGYSKIRLLFGVRYDDKQAGNAAEADVYYDDLYLGPAEANPNTP